MVLHLGEDLTVPVEKLLMIINGTNMTPELKAFVDRYKKRRRYVACQGKAKSYALVRERGQDRIYASSIAASTLEKRLDDTVTRRALFEAAVLTVEEI